jgi:hypothetical protein
MSDDMKSIWVLWVPCSKLHAIKISQTIYYSPVQQHRGHSLTMPFHYGTGYVKRQTVPTL